MKPAWQTKGLVDPTVALDPANKEYVDVGGGLFFRTGTAQEVADKVLGVVGVDVPLDVGAGTTDVTIYTAVAGFILAAFYAKLIEAVTGTGTATISGETTNGGAELLNAQVIDNTVVIDTVYGTQAAEIGPDLIASGRKWYIAAPTFKLRRVVAGSVTAGKVRVYGYGVNLP